MSDGWKLALLAALGAGGIYLISRRRVVPYYAAPTVSQNQDLTTAAGIASQFIPNPSTISGFVGQFFGSPGASGQGGTSADLMDDFGG